MAKNSIYYLIGTSIGFAIVSIIAQGAKQRQEENDKKIEKEMQIFASNLVQGIENDMIKNFNEQVQIK